MLRQLASYCALVGMSVVCLATTQAAPFRPSSTWGEFSRYQYPYHSNRGQGVGGLEVHFGSSLQLAPESLNLTERGLVVQLGDHSVTLPLSGIEVDEILQIVQRSRATRLQTSLDRIAGEKVPYADPVLRESAFKELFFRGDMEFAGMVQAQESYPPTEPLHPMARIMQLLGSDTPYRRLAQRYMDPPLSWPQIFLRFDPEAPRLVHLEFRPQILFHSPSRDVIEVTPAELKIASSPYADLQRDVDSHPDVFLARLPLVNRIAWQTAALGLVRAACSTPYRCSHLRLHEAPSERDERDQMILALAAQAPYDKPQADSLSSWTNLASWFFNPGRYAALRVNQLWQKEVDRSLKPDETESPKSWATAFDLVCRARDQLLRARSIEVQKTSQQAPGAVAPDDEDSPSALRKQAAVLLDRAKNQFTRFTVPPDPLLLAAAALVQGHLGKRAEMLDTLDHALILLDPSASLGHVAPDEHLQALLMEGRQPKVAISEHAVILNLSLAAGHFLYEAQLEDFDDLATVKLLSAQQRAYDALNEAVDSCLNGADAECTSSELRSVEHEVSLAGLSQLHAAPGRDLAYLLGRLCFLIGFAERENQEIAEGRLRFLTAYMKRAPVPEHRHVLADLARKLGQALGALPDPDWEWSRDTLEGPLTEAAYLSRVQDLNSQAFTHNAGLPFSLLKRWYYERSAWMVLGLLVAAALVALAYRRWTRKRRAQLPPEPPSHHNVLLFSPKAKPRHRLWN